ncbi:MAG: sigma factor, partial [Pseudomonadota bacterium]
MPTFISRRQRRAHAGEPARTRNRVTRSPVGLRVSRLLALSASTTLQFPLEPVRLGAGAVDGGTGGVPHDADELLDAVARRRDRGAFATLFLFYGPRLKGHLVARGADAGTAEEIVQDVMLAVWRKAEQFDAARGSAGAWIYTLARNAYLDRVRRAHRPQVDPLDPVLDVASPPAADGRLLDAESQRELAAAVG